MLKAESESAVAMVDRMAGAEMENETKFLSADRPDVTASGSAN